MNSKKILIISNDYYPQIGGTTTHVHNLCKSLAENGLDIHLLTYGNNTQCSDDSLPFKVIRINSSKNHSNLYRHLIIQILLPFKTRKYIKQNNYNLVHICSGNHMLLPLRFMHIKKPVVLTVHNLSAAEMDTNYLKIKLFDNLFVHILFISLNIVFKLNLKFGKYDHIISVSEYTKNKLLKCHVPENIMTVIPNGVSAIPINKSAFQSVHDKWFTILVIAYVCHHKGQLHIVEAMPKICQHIPNARCIIVGQIKSQDYNRQIKEKMETTHLSDEQVVITGKVTDLELGRYLSECDVYIQPSYDEGFCITIADAMLAKLPVIGTRTGAIPSLLENDRGILIEKPDPELIADAVIKYYTHPEMMKMYAEKGQQYIHKNYDWDSIAKKTMGIYDILLK